MLSISSGNLLLAGGMREFLPMAVGMALFSSAAVAAIAALTSPIKGAVAIVQPIPLVAITGMGTAVANGMIGHATPQETFIAIVAVAMLATFATGVVLLGLGFRGLGGLIRYVPFPVIGGFLAGSGWLILERGLGVILGADRRGSPRSISLRPNSPCAAAARFCSLPFSRFCNGVSGAT